MLKNVLNAVGISTPKGKPTSMKDNGGHTLRSTHTHSSDAFTADSGEVASRQAQRAAVEAIASRADAPRSHSTQSRVKNSRPVMTPALPRGTSKTAKLEMVEDSESETGGIGVSTMCVRSNSEAEHLIDQNEELRNELKVVKKQLDSTETKIRQQQTSFDVHFKHAGSKHVSKMTCLQEQIDKQHDHYKKQASAYLSQIFELQRQVHEVTQNLEIAQHNSAVNANTYQRQDHKARDQLRESESEKKKLQAALEECKVRLFDTQPYQSLTDDAISNLYTSLCDAVEGWVLSELPAESTTMRILTRSSDDAKLVAAVVARSELSVSRAFPKVDGLILVAMVFRYLFCSFLHPDVMIAGLSGSEQHLLRSVVDGMKEVTPPKDSRAIEANRVDIHRSLATAPSLKKAQSALVCEMVQRCVGWMQLVLTGLDAEPVEEVACQRLMEGAAHLAHEIRLSSTSYRYSHEIDGAEDLKEIVMHKAELQNFVVVNAKTGSRVRASAKIQADTSGRIGLKLCSIFPSLVRVGQGASKDLVLVKGVIVVKFDQDHEQKDKKKTSDPGQVLHLLDQPMSEVVDLKAFV